MSPRKLHFDSSLTGVTALLGQQCWMTFSRPVFFLPFFFSFLFYSGFFCDPAHHQEFSEQNYSWLATLWERSTTGTCFRHLLIMALTVVCWCLGVFAKVLWAFSRLIAFCDFCGTSVLVFMKLLTPCGAFWDFFFLWTLYCQSGSIEVMLNLTGPAIILFLAC